MPLQAFVLRRDHKMYARPLMCSLFIHLYGSGYRRGCLSIKNNERDPSCLADEAFRNALFAHEPLPQGHLIRAAYDDVADPIFFRKLRIVLTMSSPLNVKTIAPSCFARVSVSERRRWIFASITSVLPRVSEHKQHTSSG